MRTIAWDSETHQIGPGAVAPRMVCASFASRDERGIETWLVAQGDQLRHNLHNWLAQATVGLVRLVTHNGGYDYACAAATFPDLIPLIFEALYSGNCVDTLWNEKLLNLSTTGRLDSVDLPDGSSMEIRYSLADLERQYLGLDRTAEKEDHEDHWRIHYGMLDGLPAAEFPPEAAEYAMADARGTLLVHEGQEARVATDRASVATGSFQLLSSFCLYLETAWGMATDQVAVADMRRQLDRVLAANRDLLLASGVLRGGSGPEPHKRDQERANDAAMQLGVPLPIDDWSELEPRLRELGIKFKAPVAESICEAELQRVAGDAYRRAGAIPTLTAGRVKDGQRVQQIKLGDEETEFLATVCPIMAQCHVRKSLRKLATNQLPILESAPVVHFKYDALKETTRTSSSGNAKGKPALYPAANGQQVPKAIEGGDLKVDPRRGYRPREGTVFFDVDLHCLELACVGQITHDLLGYSVHLDKYNAGYDLHAFLAAQILLHTEREGAAAEVQQAIDGGSLDDQYDAFRAFKKCGDKALETVYKDTRNLAKPNGLGFPGGIGPAKMVVLARTAYGVTMTEAEAHEIREIWRATYTEMLPYFDWIASQRDYRNEARDAEGRPIDLYRYSTPMGAVRVGCTYCSIANGKAMQSPGAEAAKAGNNDVVRACHDLSRGSVLYGARPIAFVHDQIIGETTRDAALWHEQATEVSRLMIAASARVLPKVRMRTEALLTRVWSKSAEPVLDGSGRLIPWEPK
jgi:hypothetical protein